MRIQPVLSFPGYGQAARLLRPALVDPALSPPATEATANPPRAVKNAADVVDGLPLREDQRREVLRIVGDGRGGYVVATSLRRALDGADPGLVREVVSRANRFAAGVRAALPRGPAPALGVVAALGLKKSDAEPVLGPPPTRNRAKFPFVATIDFQGLPIRVETRKGETRSGTDADGKAWSVTMPAHYGEFAATLGADGDPVDVFVGPNRHAHRAYVVHLQDPSTGEHDEDKTFLGFNSADDALACFRAAYNRRDLKMGPARALSISELREWLADRENRGRKLDGGRALAKSETVIAIGKHGGKIIGYAHGDHTRPIYADKNPHLTQGHVYPVGSGSGGHAVDVPIHDAHGPFAWTTHEAIAGGKPAVIHLPTGRAVKVVTPQAGAKGPKATASIAVKLLAQQHGQTGLEAPPGGFVAPAEFQAMRAVIQGAETGGAKAPPPGAPPPAPASLAPADKPKSVQPTTSAPPTVFPAPQPLTKQEALEIADKVSFELNMPFEQVKAALTATDAGPKNPGVAQARARIEHAILKLGYGRKDAILEVLGGGHHDAAAVGARIDQIGKGDKALLKKEFGSTPVYDLQVLKSADASATVSGNGGQCSPNREITVWKDPGTGKHTTGNFRHELGHAVMGAWGFWFGGVPPQSPAGVVIEHWKQAVAKYKALGKNPPPGGHDHQWFEENCGVIGKRALDTPHENAAEHYRGYHREVLRHRFGKDGGGQLDTYRQRHPEMAAVWDARYTAALLASAAQKGLW